MIKSTEHLETLEGAHHQQELFGSEITERHNYELFTAHERTDGSLKTDEQLRSEYINLTDDLIHKMVSGVSVTDPETRLAVTKVPDYVVWLDKSARPVSWLTKELWPVLAADSEGNVPEMPEFRYVNIDREQWVNTLDPNGIGSMDVNRVNEGVIRSLRSIFVETKDKENGLTPEIDEAPAELDGKTILIVDEVRSTGRTLNIAQSFFQKAFPSARIATTHWMGGITQVGDATGNADLPVWYSKESVYGRGVGDRDIVVSQESTSLTQRLGALFLSTRIGKDERTEQLRREVKMLARDAVAKNVLIVPSLQREDSDFDERALRLNGLDNFEDFIKKKQELDHQTTSPGLLSTKR